MLDIIAVVEGRRAVEGAVTLPYDVVGEHPLATNTEGRGRRTRRRTSALLRRMASAIEPRTSA